MHLLLEMFFDPIFRATALSTLCLGLVASLVGVFVYLKKESLVAETLSHTAYPGAVLGALIASFFMEDPSHIFFPFLCMGGAFLFSFGSYFFLLYLEKNSFFSKDILFCFILSSFFGIGVLLASFMQFEAPQFYRQSLSFLFGEASTLREGHAYFFGGLSLCILLFFYLFERGLTWTIFDPEGAKVMGLSLKFYEGLLVFLICTTLVAGIRSVGATLISALLIAPPAAARYYTSNLKKMLFLSSFIGALGCFMGVFISYYGQNIFPSFFKGITFPMGSTIVLVLSLIFSFSCLFAPEKGLFFRKWRLFIFSIKTIQENILKALWKREEQHKITEKKFLKESFSLSFLSLFFILFFLKLKKKIYFSKKNIFLTEEGVVKARQIVRLHRLWEVYLFEYLKVPKEEVHKSAEEIEHFLTEPLEKELLKLLKHPKKDPHEQPIPI